jgi:hypothetical protein
MWDVSQLKFHSDEIKGSEIFRRDGHGKYEGSHRSEGREMCPKW